MSTAEPPADMFDEMIASVREQTAKMMLMVIPTTQIKAPTAPRETGAGLKGGPAAAPGARFGRDP